MIDERTNIKEICASFFPSCEIKKIILLTTGNINNTYKITIEKDKEENYILQRINKFVFKKPILVMENIRKISEHLKKRSNEQTSIRKRESITYVKSKENKIYLVDKNGEYWRCYNYFENSITFNTTENLEIIEEVGFAFGEFQFLLDNFDANCLVDIIPNFHNTKMRLNDLQSAFLIDEFQRAKLVENEYKFLISKKNFIWSIIQMFKSLPIRVTHNDTKCNNVLIDINSQKAITVIDLDTVMAGIVAFDFGDGIRSIASTCDEDETDVNKIKVDLGKFKAFTNGFVNGLNKKLSDEEFDSLPFGILLMTLELSIRFLTDFLCGDKYFKIKTPKHNLERAKCQIELFKNFEKNFDVIKQYIHKLKCEN